jgi:Flp pilus assembly protein TadB
MNNLLERGHMSLISTPQRRASRRRTAEHFDSLAMYLFSLVLVMVVFGLINLYGGDFLTAVEIAAVGTITSVVGVAFMRMSERLRQML